MELMASVSSALLDLSMQQVSTQAYRMPASAASLHVMRIFSKPFFRLVAVLLHVAEGDFFLFPGVREDGVFGDVSGDEFLKKAGGRVDESHGVGDVLAPISDGWQMGSEG